MPANRPTRLALYARVSTRGQDPASQLDELRAYAERRGSDALEYIDHGISGRRASRPALDALLEAVHRHEVDAVVCTELSRLARSVRHLHELAEELQAKGVDLVVLRQAIDTSCPSGRLLFSVLGAIAAFETELTTERVAAGVQAARRRGVRMGRPRALDPEQVERLERLHAAGMPQRRIAALLQVSKGTISAELGRLRALRQAA